MANKQTSPDRESASQINFNDEGSAFDMSLSIRLEPSGLCFGDQTFVSKYGNRVSSLRAKLEENFDEFGDGNFEVLRDQFIIAWNYGEIDGLEQVQISPVLGIITFLASAENLDKLNSFLSEVDANFVLSVVYDNLLEFVPESTSHPVVVWESGRFTGHFCNDNLVDTFIFHFYVEGDELVRALDQVNLAIRGANLVGQVGVNLDLFEESQIMITCTQEELALFVGLQGLAKIRHL